MAFVVSSQAVAGKARANRNVCDRSRRSLRVWMAAPEPEGSEVVPPAVPKPQGRVPVQSGAQADLQAFQKEEPVVEEKKDAVQAAREEIEELQAQMELTDEQKMKIKRMKKRVTRAAAIQESQGFADAWAKQNAEAGRVDAWFWIGLIFLLTPPVILGWGVWSGIIPLE